MCPNWRLAESDNHLQSVNGFILQSRLFMLESIRCKQWIHLLARKTCMYSRFRRNLDSMKMDADNFGRYYSLLRCRLNICGFLAKRLACKIWTYITHIFPPDCLPACVLRVAQDVFAAQTTYWDLAWVQCMVMIVIPKTLHLSVSRWNHSKTWMRWISSAGRKSPV